MRSHLVDLGSDKRAFDLIQTNLEVRSYNHTLSRLLLKLRHQYCDSSFAIVPDWIDLSTLTDLSKSKEPPPGDYEPDMAPEDLLVRFVVGNLASDSSSCFACENSGQIRRTVEYWAWTVPPPLYTYGAEEVYHIFWQHNLSIDIVRAAIADSMQNWGTAILSAIQPISNNSEIGDDTLDLLAINTRRIVVPAFDGDGYIACELQC